MSAAFKTEGTYVPDSLIAGNADLLVARKVTVASGPSLPRGAVLGKVSASGKYVLSASAATDGSQAPDLVLAESVDASGGDKPALAYARGDFNAFALTFGAGHTAATVLEGLRAKGINVLPSMV